MAQDARQRNGIEYAPGVVGKYLFRVRETYVAGTAADLIRSRRVGALKLDLVLRGLALLPEHAGGREPGHVLRRRGSLSYQLLHDLCRDPHGSPQQAPHDIEDDAATLEKKRTWVREQLQVLEARQLVQRSTDPRGRRPEITVLRDRCDGEPFDDPGATANRHRRLRHHLWSCHLVTALPQLGRSRGSRIPVRDDSRPFRALPRPRPRR